MNGSFHVPYCHTSYDLHSLYRIPFLQKLWHNSSPHSTRFFSVKKYRLLRPPPVPRDRLLSMRKAMHHPLMCETLDGTVDGSEIRRSPVEVCSLSTSIYRVFCTAQVISWISEPSTVCRLVIGMGMLWFSDFCRLVHQGLMNMSPAFFWGGC